MVFAKDDFKCTWFLSWYNAFECDRDETGKESHDATLILECSTPKSVFLS